jgi:hypothetical protein
MKKSYRPVRPELKEHNALAPLNPKNPRFFWESLEYLLNIPALTQTKDRGIRCIEKGPEGKRDDAIYRFTETGRFHCGIWGGMRTMVAERL